ncbi:MAG: L-rhamnose mutarotase [Ahrensia sp.]|nr:L-rhamnose mutarotase [Ahrensia sp.]
MGARIAFRMVLNPGQAAEYKRRHDAIWPELTTALRKAGVSDYTIWLDPETNHLFATLLLAEDNSLADVPKTEINRRWWDFMADIMAYDDNNQPVQAPLEKMFEMP